MASLISLTGGSDDIMMAIAFERFGSSDLTTAGFLGGSHAAQRRHGAWGVRGAAWRVGFVAGLATRSRCPSCPGQPHAFNRQAEELLTTR